MIFFFLPRSNKYVPDPLGLGCLAFAFILIFVISLLGLLGMIGAVCYRYYASVDAVQAEHNYIRHSFELPVLLKGSADGDIEQYEDGCQYIRTNMYWMDRHGYVLKDDSEYILLDEHKDKYKTPFDYPSIDFYNHINYYMFDGQ